MNRIGMGLVGPGCVGMHHVDAVRRQNELWIGHRDSVNELLPKDPAPISADARRYAHLPGGHQEGWPDTFANVIRDIYSCVAKVAAVEMAGGVR